MFCVLQDLALWMKTFSPSCVTMSSHLLTEISGDIRPLRLLQEGQALCTRSNVPERRPPVTVGNRC